EYIGVYVSTDGGQTWSDEIAGFTATGTVETYYVDTAAFAGQAICVAFRHYNVTDMFSVNLDAVEVVGAADPGLLGDVDGNGVVDLIDASLLNRYVLGLVGANDLDLTVADVDASGNIDLIDVICIMRMVLNIGA
ncbi:MAG: dockerin type I domain-containing protein, partial [Eubacteriales bacterium]|nr:dockerin type I domain-containing protein [Eubacteriales bacterium]